MNSVNEQSDCVVNNEKSDQDPTRRSLNTRSNLTQSNYTEYKKSNFENNIDPNNNYFNSVNVSCLYYTNDTFNDLADKFKGILVIHFNSRSLNKNISSIQNLLSELHYSFDLIAVTETWLDPESIEHCKLNGYHVIHQLRDNKRGGGCCIFVKNSYKCGIVKSMCCSVTDNI